jgi:sortase (surface protein transpeptidase)
VILGHVDSKHGPAVFYRLKELDRGDEVAVKLSTGKTAHYQVTRVAQYLNEDFPAKQVYAGSPDRPALNLVTCGGKYDREAGGYQSNVVVYTRYLWATDGEPTSSAS